MGHDIKPKIRGLLCTSGPVRSHRVTCHVCGRRRHVRRTGFWPLPRPGIRRICGSRWAGRLASFLFARPDFVIIGVSKAGTTSLYDFINAHPRVAPAWTKEVNYFSSPTHYALGPLWYGACFPGRLHRKNTPSPITVKSLLYGACLPVRLRRHCNRLLKRGAGPDTAVSGEATPRYLQDPVAPRRMRRVLPDVRLLVILRNPVDRAYSDYQMCVRKRRESLSFEAAIENEMKKGASWKGRLGGDPDLFFLYNQRHSYLGKGLYADHLGRWFEQYGRDRLLVLTTEEMAADPQGVLDDTLGFLGLEPFRAAGGGLKNLNVGEYGSMNPETRRALVEYFRPHNERLYGLLGGRWADGMAGWDL